MRKLIHTFSDMFQRSVNDVALYVMKKGKDLLIESLYVDNIIITINTSRLINKFKGDIKLEFEITDLGTLIIQDDREIFLSQEKYVCWEVWYERVQEHKYITCPTWQKCWVWWRLWWINKVLEFFWWLVVSVCINTRLDVCKLWSFNVHVCTTQKALSRSQKGFKICQKYISLWSLVYKRQESRVIRLLGQRLGWLEWRQKKKHV